MLSLALIALAALTACGEKPSEDAVQTIQPQKQTDCLHGICLGDTMEIVKSKGCKPLPNAMRGLWECEGPYWVRVGATLSPDGRVLLVDEAPAIREDLVEKSFEAAKVGMRPPWEDLFEWQIKIGREPEADYAARRAYTLKIMEELGWTVDEKADSFKSFPEDVVFRHPERFGVRVVSSGGFVGLQHPKYESLMRPGLVSNYDGSGHLAQ